MLDPRTASKTVLKWGVGENSQTGAGWKGGAGEKRKGIQRECPFANVLVASYRDKFSLRQSQS